MEEFLVDLSVQEHQDAYKFEAAQLDLNNLTMAPAAKNLSDIKLFQRVTEESVGKEEEHDIKDSHRKKLEKFRQMKDWQQQCQEDEIDMEGERILADLKNFKSEYIFHKQGFY